MLKKKKSICIKAWLGRWFYLLPPAATPLLLNAPNTVKLGMLLVKDKEMCPSSKFSPETNDLY
jgi:hypothetical protein